MVRGGVMMTLVLSTLLLATLLLGHLQNYEVNASDDLVWLYFTSVETRDRERAYDLQARARSALAAQGASDITLYRFDLRTAYNRNYLAGSWLWRWGADLGRLGGASTSDYPAYLARAMIAGFAFSYVVVSLLFVAACVMLRDDRILPAAVAAMAVAAATDAVLDFAHVTWAGPLLLVYEPTSLGDAVRQFLVNATAMIVNPIPAVSPFGSTSRSHLILLLPIVFALRWSGRPAAAYLTLAALSIFHQSQAALLFVLLVGVDLITRPTRFLDWRVSAAAAINVLSIAVRETLDTAVGLRGPIWGVVALVTAMLAALVLAGRNARLVQMAASAEHRLPWSRSASPVKTDVIALLGAWLAIAIFAHVMDAVIGGREASYFWSQVSARALSVIRPALLLAFGLFLVNRSGRSLRPAVAAAVIAVILLPLTAVNGRRAIDGRGERLRADLYRIEASVGSELPWARLAKHSEVEIYYALSRYLDAGR